MEKYQLHRSQTVEKCDAFAAHLDDRAHTKSAPAPAAAALADASATDATLTCAGGQLTEDTPPLCGAAAGFQETASASTAPAAAALENNSRPVDRIVEIVPLHLPSVCGGVSSLTGPTTDDALPAGNSLRKNLKFGDIELNRAEECGSRVFSSVRDDKTRGSCSRRRGSSERINSKSTESLIRNGSSSTTTFRHETVAWVGLPYPPRPVQAVYSFLSRMSTQVGSVRKQQRATVLSEVCQSISNTLISAGATCWSRVGEFVLTPAWLILNNHLSLFLYVLLLVERIIEIIFHFAACLLPAFVYVLLALLVSLLSLPPGSSSTNGVSDPVTTASQQALPRQHILRSVPHHFCSTAFVPRLDASEALNNEFNQAFTHTLPLKRYKYRPSTAHSHSQAAAVSASSPPSALRALHSRPAVGASFFPAVSPVGLLLNSRSGFQDVRSNCLSDSSIATRIESRRGRGIRSNSTRLSGSTMATLIESRRGSGIRSNSEESKATRDAWRAPASFRHPWKRFFITGREGSFFSSVAYRRKLDGDAAGHKASATPRRASANERETRLMTAASASGYAPPRKMVVGKPSAGTAATTGGAYTAGVREKEKETRVCAAADHGEQVQGRDGDGNFPVESFLEEDSSVSTETAAEAARGTQPKRHALKKADRVRTHSARGPQLPQIETATPGESSVAVAGAEKRKTFERGAPRPSLEQRRCYAAAAAGEKRNTAASGAGGTAKRAKQNEEERREGEAKEEKRGGIWFVATVITYGYVMLSHISWGLILELPTFSFALYLCQQLRIQGINFSAAAAADTSRPVFQQFLPAPSAENIPSLEIFPRGDSGNVSRNRSRPPLCGSGSSNSNSSATTRGHSSSDSDGGTTQKPENYICRCSSKVYSPSGGRRCCSVDCISRVWGNRFSSGDSERSSVRSSSVESGRMEACRLLRRTTNHNVTCCVCSKERKRKRGGRRGSSPAGTHGGSSKRHSSGVDGGRRERTNCYKTECIPAGGLYVVCSSISTNLCSETSQPLQKESKRSNDRQVDLLGPYPATLLGSEAEREHLPVTRTSSAQARAATMKELISIDLLGGKEDGKVPEGVPCLPPTIRPIGDTEVLNTAFAHCITSSISETYLTAAESGWQVRESGFRKSRTDGCFEAEGLYWRSRDGRRQISADNTSANAGIQKQEKGVFRKELQATMELATAVKATTARSAGRDVFAKRWHRETRKTRVSANTFSEAAAEDPALYSVRGYEKERKDTAVVKNAAVVDNSAVVKTGAVLEIAAVVRREHSRPRRIKTTAAHEALHIIESVSACVDEEESTAVQAAAPERKAGEELAKTARNNEKASLAGTRNGDAGASRTECLISAAVLSIRRDQRDVEPLEYIEVAAHAADRECTAIRTPAVTKGWLEESAVERVGKESAFRKEMAAPPAGAARYSTCHYPELNEEHSTVVVGRKSRTHSSIERKRCTRCSAESSSAKDQRNKFSITDDEGVLQVIGSKPRYITGNKTRQVKCCSCFASEGDGESESPLSKDASKAAAAALPKCTAAAEERKPKRDTTAIARGGKRPSPKVDEGVGGPGICSASGSHWRLRSQVLASIRRCLHYLAGRMGCHYVWNTLLGVAVRRKVVRALHPFQLLRRSPARLFPNTAQRFLITTSCFWLLRGLHSNIFLDPDSDSSPATKAFAGVNSNAFLYPPSHFSNRGGTRYSNTESTTTHDENSRHKRTLEKMIIEKKSSGDPAATESEFAGSFASWKAILVEPSPVSLKKHFFLPSASQSGEARWANSAQQPQPVRTRQNGCTVGWRPLQRRHIDSRFLWLYPSLLQIKQVVRDYLEFLRQLSGWMAVLLLLLVLVSYSLLSLSSTFEVLPWHLVHTLLVMRHTQLCVYAATRKKQVSKHSRSTVQQRGEQQPSEDRKSNDDVLRKGSDLQPWLQERSQLQVTHSHQAKEEVGADEEQICIFCFEPFIGTDVLRLVNTCGHIFHRECMDTWLFKKKKETCPFCGPFRDIRFA